jgi:hypothetical protein
MIKIFVQKNEILWLSLEKIYKKIALMPRKNYIKKV